MLLESIRKDRRIADSAKLEVIFNALRNARSDGRMKAAELLEQAFDLYSEGCSYERMCYYQDHLRAPFIPIECE